MPEEIAQGKSLDEIRSLWAEKLALQPEELELEVLEKPSFFSRSWKVRVSWQEVAAALTASDESTEEFSLINDNPEMKLNCTTEVRAKGEGYAIIVGDGISLVVPSPEHGETKRGGVVQQAPFAVTPGEEVEFSPYNNPGCRRWTLEIKMQGLSAGAKVENRPGIKYTLPEQISSNYRLFLPEHIKKVKTAPWGEVWDKQRLEEDLRTAGIVHGIVPDLWEKVLLVEGYKEMIVAQATMPVPPVAPKLESFVGIAKEDQDQKDRIDFFASKIQLVNEGDVLVRKIPGVTGTPGKNVLGKEIPAGNFKDFKLKGKKNVNLSEDGNVLTAAVGGHPIKIDEYTYMVENVYALNRDVDLETGSVDFSGDVVIHGNVQDSFHVFAGGKVEINGSVSHAEIRAENGLKIYNNVLGGKIVVGEKFVVRSEMMRLLSELNAQLLLCLQQTASVLPSAAKSNIKPGQCLKLVIEKQFFDLPKLALRTQTFLENNKDELVNSNLMAPVRTAAHFLAGLGPLDLQALPFLTKASQDLAEFVDTMALEMPEKLDCYIGYAQGAEIQCGGAFECQKGVYNSIIRAESDIIIEGVCRGGKLYSGGNIRIKELGGAGVSKTHVQMKGSNRLEAEYCHPNVTVVVDKEIILIEEPAKKLEIYRERGIVQVDKLKG